MTYKILNLQYTYGACDVTCLRWQKKTALNNRLTGNQIENNLHMIAMQNNIIKKPSTQSKTTKNVKQFKLAIK